MSTSAPCLPLTKRLPSVPRFQGAAAGTYRWRLGRQSLASFTGTVQHVGSRFTQIDDHAEGVVEDGSVGWIGLLDRVEAALSPEQREELAVVVHVRAGPLPRQQVDDRVCAEAFDDLAQLGNRSNAGRYPQFSYKALPAVQTREALNENTLLTSYNGGRGVAKGKFTITNAAGASADANAASGLHRIDQEASAALTMPSISPRSTTV